MGNIWLDPRLLLALGPLSFICETLYGATSFGPSILFNAGWQICYLMKIGNGTLTTAALHMTTMEGASALVQIGILWKHIDWILVLAICLPGGSCMAIGQILMIQLDGPWLKRALGIILLTMALHRVYVTCSARTLTPDSAQPAGLDLRRPRVILSIFFWFSFAGLMAGITSVAGPPMMMFVSIHANELNFTTWRGSSAVLRLVMNLSRGVVFAINHRFHFDRSWLLDCSMALGAWLGLIVGNRLAGKLSDARSLNLFIVSMLCFSSALMVASASNMSMQRALSMGIGCLVVLMIFVLLVRAVILRYRRSIRTDHLLHQDTAAAVSSPVVETGSLRSSIQSSSAA